MPSAADFAAAYCKKYGLALVKIPAGKKGPTGAGWNLPGNYITDPTEAREFWTSRPEWNMGVVLGPSGLCSLDVDSPEHTRTIMARYGIDIDALAASYPTVVGNPARFRIAFSVPLGVELGRRALSWPNPDDPDGSIHRDLIRRAVAAEKSGDAAQGEALRADAKRFARITVFELRAGDVQDVLPPSIHPGTGKPYEWRTRPNGRFGELPADLAAIWADWDRFRREAEAMCPWAPKAAPAPAPRAVQPPAGESVIDAYNAAHGIEQALSAYGYTQHGPRWLSPHSSSGEAGVIVHADQNKCWINHASDPLCSTDSGRPVAPFDLFCEYEHQGDVKKAVRAAADGLGMKPQRGERAVPAAHPAFRPDTPAFDPDTGEILAPLGAQCVDYVAWLPDVNDKGKPLATIDNLREICRRLEVTIRYNVISKEEEILIPGAAFSLDNRQNASLAWLNSECSKFRFPTAQLSDYVTYLADQNQYNPVAAWVTSKPWDGHDRVAELIATVRAKNEADEGVKRLKAAFIRRWMTSAIAAAFRPTGVSAHGVLVFQGDQYLGKTKWFKSLVPASLGVLQDGVILRPDDRDSVKQCVANWLVELGELDATFRKSDIAALKAFITRDKDVLRRAYARKESEFARRTVFFASVNPKEFLHDPTGNRRYWTIECEHLNYDHTIDMQQAWAQVYEQLYQAGEGWYLEADEMAHLNSHNKDFEVNDPIEELIASGLAWAANETEWEWKTATEVLRTLGRDKPSQYETTRVSSIVRERNGARAKKSNGTRYLFVPPKVQLYSTW